MRLARTPTGATVPNVYAQIGAVTSVAAAAGASRRMTRVLRSVARAAQITAATAPTDSQAPTERTAQGSRPRTTSAAIAMNPRGATTRCRKRATPSKASITAARVAGAGRPSSQQ